MGKRRASDKEEEDQKPEIQKNKVRKIKNDFRPEKYRDMMPKKLSFKVVDGLRFLDPYWAVFANYAKGRWIGREVCEIFATEFLSNNKNYPKAAVRMGRLFVNGKQMTDPNYRLRISDRLVHLSHRHELPILAEPQIKVLVDTEKYFVINKPPSMPVHGCGQYRIHSVVGLLRTMHNIKDLKVCHRLDRTTSGVLIFAKDHNTDIEFKQLMMQNKLAKEYVCKVEGIFPSEEITCKAPIGTLSIAMGIQCVRPDGKRAVSHFRRLFANEAENTSIVSCSIETGRTHQIRIHLQYLGYPIQGDRIYNDHVWGPENGKEGNYGKSIEELVGSVHERHRASNWFDDEDPEYASRLERIGNDTTLKPDSIDLDNFCLDDLPSYDPLCLGCNVTKKVPDERHFSMKLHCRRYKGADWEFEAPLPSWARYEGDNQERKLEEFPLACNTFHAMG